MTMDVNNRKHAGVETEVSVQLLNNNTEELAEVTHSTKMPIKRSFDVAFLMLPDDKLKQKQMRAARQIATNYETSRASLDASNVSSYHRTLQSSPTISGGDDEDDQRSDTNSPLGLNRSSSSASSELQKIQNHAKYLHNIAHLNKHQQIFGDPHLGKKISPSQFDEDDHNLMGSSNSTVAATVRLKIPQESISPSHHQTQQKSAFTKVNMLPKTEPTQSSNTSTRMSPNLSISPDLSYQNSLSPSPPILRHQYQSFPSPNMHFKNAYQNTLFQENLGFSTIQNNVGQHQATSASNSLMESAFLLKSNQDQVLSQNFSAAKMRPVLQYRPEFSHYGTYPAFPPQEMLKMSSADVRNPTAAIFSSLLPPSLAALSLPAQNVCAKCNISFRMTSDLVYHMRSHHKNDIASDMNKRRREEKLKCPVCAESFRERHHLTRHMTAHQDKEGDALDTDDVQKKKGSASGSATTTAFGVFNK